jgi:outer membrane protein OmpA-like peptidoglycan-associated protein
MKKNGFFLTMLIIVGFSVMTANAQSFGSRLGKAIKKSAERTVERKAEQKTEQAVGKAIDKATDPNSYKDDKKEDPKKDGNKSKDNSQSPEASSSKPQTNRDNVPQGVKTAEMTYAKSDFVAGDVIIFEDLMDNEKLGEFPSQWDLIKGTSEVVMVNGKKGFELTTYYDILVPLMKNPKNYLGDAFTVEFDFLSVKGKSDHKLFPFIEFWAPDKKGVNESLKGPLLAYDNYYFGDYAPLMAFGKAADLKDNTYYYFWDNGDGDKKLKAGKGNLNLDFDTWHHIAISFNKRAWKVYVNGERVVNVPNVKTPPGWFRIILGRYYSGTDKQQGSIVFSNFRVAKGAVPLYDRMMTNGKIITYGITFDMGKSTVKPESMGEINRIAQLMKENPDLKFSVEGHTDNTGNAANNQTLSEARSKAVVEKLIEMGIAKDRLKSAGKGQTVPVADNSTDEGKAKNRRVEFVKIK